MFWPPSKFTRIRFSKKQNKKKTKNKTKPALFSHFSARMCTTLVFKWPRAFGVLFHEICYRDWLVFIRDELHVKGRVSNLLYHFWLLWAHINSTQLKSISIGIWTVQNADLCNLFITAICWWYKIWAIICCCLFTLPMISVDIQGL